MRSILHLIPTLQGGGAERQVAMLATEQARRGWRVHLGLRKGGPHEHLLEGVTVHYLGDLWGVHPLLVARLLKLIRGLDPDIIQSWLPQMDILAGLIAPVSSAKWVLSERASAEAYSAIPFTSFLRWVLTRGASAIVANSNEGARYWAKLERSSRRVVVIANAVDVSRITKAPARPCSVSKADHTILFVGRFAEQKAPLLLIQAIGLLNNRANIGALLIGDGPLRGFLETEIVRRGLGHCIELRPYDRDWWGMLKTAAALVSTSVFEGQPNVILEAMAAHCPVIVSDIPTHRAILDKCSGALFPPRDPAALAHEMVAIVTNRETAIERTKRAFEFVENLTIAKAADAYEELYQGIV